MGIHSGAAEVRDGGYYGPGVNRAARLSAAAHGGQIVVPMRPRSCSATISPRAVPARDGCLTVLTALGELETPAVLAGVMDAESCGAKGGLSGPALERREAAIVRLRAELGADEYAAAAARGAAMSADEALAFAATERARIRVALDAD